MKQTLNIETRQPFIKVYDKYIVAFSGGKDSTACFLHLLDLGIPKEKIELWHHDIDGKGETFMDWEVTPAYCQAFADEFGVPLYFSWKDGGFERELMRNNTSTARNYTETPNGTIKLNGRESKGTRLKFPQVSPDLSVRWCSAYLKIDVCASAIRGQQRFNNINTVIISGERGEESAARAKYAKLEPDRSDNRGGKRVDRYVDRMRPIRDWAETEVWDIIERYKVRAHPCYYLGWSRCSCKFCIFGNANQFASAYKISPKQGERISALEDEFGITIKRKGSLKDLYKSGKPYKEITEEYSNISTSKNYNLSIIMDKWELPSGAYGESCGPT